MSTDLTSYVTRTGTEFSSVVRTKWETELLKIAEGYLVAERFATSKVMGRGEGGTLKLNRLLRPSKKTTADTEGAMYGYADAKRLSSNYIDVTPSMFGESFVFSDRVPLTTFISDEDNKKVIANQLARSLEYQVQTTIATQCLRFRIDKDATYITSGTASSGSTTTLVDAGILTDADDTWNGGFVTVTNAGGANYDITAQVTDSDSSDASLTFAALPQAMDSTSSYRVTVGTALAATDVLTTSALLDVAAQHELLETEKFDGGTLRGFIHAAQERDLWNDTVWSTSAQYDDSGRYKNYKLVRWIGMEFMIASELYRESVAGVASETGVVYVAPIFGRNSYSIVRWGQGVGDFGVEWHYKDKADSYDLRNTFSAISWKAHFAAKVLRATSIIGLMTGATSLDLVTT